MTRFSSARIAIGWLGWVTGECAGKFGSTCNLVHMFIEQNWTRLPAAAIAADGQVKRTLKVGGPRLGSRTAEEMG